MTQPEDVLDALDRAYRAARTSLTDLPTGQEHFDRATRLHRQLERYVGEIADERAVGAGRIWDDEKLILVELGRRTGVKKSRAAEWVDTYRRMKETG